MYLKRGVTLIALLAFCLAVEARDGSLLLNSFNSDREGWQAYDYNGGTAGGGNVFYPLNWEQASTKCCAPATATAFRFSTSMEQ